MVCRDSMRLQELGPDFLAPIDTQCIVGPCSSWESEQVMPQFTIVEAPSPLGVGPTGVEVMGTALLEGGLQQALSATHAGRVEPPPHDPVRDPESQICMESASVLLGWSIASSAHFGADSSRWFSAATAISSLATSWPSAAWDQRAIVSRWPCGLLSTRSVANGGGLGHGPCARDRSWSRGACRP
jgi:hypothetical protein